MTDLDISLNETCLEDNFSVKMTIFQDFFVFIFLNHTLCLKSHAWLVLSPCLAPIGLERGKHQVHPTVTVNLLLERGQ